MSQNLSSAAVVIGALRVKLLIMLTFRFFDAAHFNPNGISYSYQLDSSIFYFMVDWGIFSNYLNSNR